MDDRDYSAEADGIETAVAREHARWRDRLADAIEAGDVEGRPPRTPGALTYAALTPAGEELLRRARGWQGRMRQRLGQADRLRHIQMEGVKDMERKSTIPDDGYADGGTPYTDEEMDAIDRDGGRILEGLPTPPLARDRAAETGEAVQDCFGEWHGGQDRERATRRRPEAGLDFERLVRRVVAESADVRTKRDVERAERERSSARRTIRADESEGARREREMDELRQQYDAPAWEGERHIAPTIAGRHEDAMEDFFDFMRHGSNLGAVALAAFTEDREEALLDLADDVASGSPQAKAWFSTLADKLRALMSIEKELRGR